MEHPTSSPTDRPTHLIVFDFDWSLVNENSDTYVVHALDPSGAIWAAAEKRLAQDMQWTALIGITEGSLDADQSKGLTKACGRGSFVCCHIDASTSCDIGHIDAAIFSGLSEEYFLWIASPRDVQNGL